MKPAEEELELTRLLAAEADGRDHDIAMLRGRGPDAAELASLASRLALQGVDVTPPSGAPPAEFRWKKWAIGGGGGASALLLWLALRAPQAVPISAPPVAPTPEHARAAASHASETTTSPGSPARTPAPGIAPVTRSATAPGTEAPAPLTALDGASPSASATLPPGSSTRTAPPTPTNGSQRITPGATPAAQASNGSELVPIPATAAPSEIELLRDARFALKQSPARALELTDQHARLYPGGKLTQERELIAITALVSLGRRTAALSRGAGFERAFPRSPYIEQLNELLR